MFFPQPKCSCHNLTEVVSQRSMNYYPLSILSSLLLVVQTDFSRLQRPPSFWARYFALQAVISQPSSCSCPNHFSVQQTLTEGLLYARWFFKVLGSNSDLDTQSLLSQSIYLWELNTFFFWKEEVDSMILLQCFSIMLEDLKILYSKLILAWQMISPESSWCIYLRKVNLIEHNLS